MTDDPYSHLGLTASASAEEIRRAYHHLARQLHPDHNPDPAAHEHFLRVQAAFLTLSNPERRAEYDREHPEAAAAEAAADTRAPQAASAATTAVQLSIQYSRPTLPLVPTAQLVYALLRFSPLEISAAANQPRPPLNLCLVLDRSTSMQGERMDTLKAAAIELVRQLGREDRLAVVVFSDRADVLISAGTLRRREEIETAIQMIHPSGGTEIRHGLDAGLFELRRTFSRGAINHLLLLTDGRTYGDEVASLNLADQAGMLGIGITALGLGEEWNDAFLDELAARTGGSSMYIDHPRALKQFFQEKLVGLGNIYAQQVELQWQTPPQVALRYAFRLQPDPSPLPLTSPLRLGSIPQDARLEILVEILLPPLQPLEKLQPLLNGELTFLLPRAPEVIQRLPLSLARPLDPAAPIADIAPRPVFQAAQQVSLYRLQERARSDAQNGQVEAASRRLLHLATHLLYQGSRSLAQAVLTEADHLQQNQIFSIKGEKRIKYGTRALALPEPTTEEERAAQ